MWDKERCYDCIEVSSSQHASSSCLWRVQICVATLLLGHTKHCLLLLCSVLCWSCPNCLIETLIAHCVVAEMAGCTRCNAPLACSASLQQDNPAATGHWMIFSSRPTQCYNHQLRIIGKHWSVLHCKTLNQTTQEQTISKQCCDRVMMQQDKSTQHS